MKKTGFSELVPHPSNKAFLVIHKDNIEETVVATTAFAFSMDLEIMHRYMTVGYHEGRHLTQNKFQFYHAYPSGTGLGFVMGHPMDYADRWHEKDAFEFEENANKFILYLFMGFPLFKY